jgi:ketosteroid isomerase-like protein
MTSKEIILQHELRLIESMENGDVDTLQDMLHDDLLFAIPSGQTVSKEIDLGHFRSGAIKLAEIAVEDSQVQIIGDNAIVSTLVRMAGSFQAQPFQGTFRYLRVWKSFGGTWKVIGGAGIHLPPAGTTGSAQQA